ncbi:MULTISPECIES: hypothetical protein [unclassified Streptomyces]|jgi:hypothetical protein|uniref:hypothetical protein n=1 Tax=unclassified Streptomyces TaxID=2593676 RepID=UPI0029A09213|nr:hypothetical protein [Streptomyces sp. ME18-1-4]MDX3248228.1 hypothetical protein [Streptomyces sp. ME18-1-4]
MHMNSVPQHLHSEDRQEYERILDEALRSAPHHPELAAVGQRLNPEQLRTMALNASALITVAAASEYQHYIKVREELRHPAPSTPSSTSETGSAEPGATAMGLATTMGEAAQAAEAAGAGAVAAVLTPVLAGTAAVIFLLVGYLLRALDPDQAFARTMLTAGWAFGAVAVAAILVATVALLLAALRNRPSLEAEPYGELSEEVAAAREAWREALLERGILPFLREALAAPGAAPALHTDPVPPTVTGRLPKIGYDRPGFTSPDDGRSTGPRPSFSSPDYTSPDFGGPENRPE